jgi:hypothetical protein
MCCKHYHTYTVDYDKVMGFYMESNECSECKCPRVILDPLEFLEYKYEESIGKI